MSRISIKGFKSFRELDNFELTNLNILIGANGAGKSNFIKLFEMLRNLIDLRLESYIAKAGGVEKILYFGGKTTEKLEVKIFFDDEQYLNGYEFILEPAGDGLIFSEETVYFGFVDPERKMQRIIHNTTRETKLFEKSNKEKSIEKYVIDSIKSWQLYHFHDTSDTSNMKKLQSVGDQIFFRADGSNIAAYLFWLKNKYELHYKKIVDTIRLVAPFFHDFTLRPWPGNENQIKLEWAEKGSDQYFDANSLSDGTLRFMCLTTLFTQPDLPATIILDEPELGLHPYAIQILAGMIKSTSQKTQIIISTQSVTFLNQFEPKDIIIVERGNEQTLFKRPGPEEVDTWLEDYAIGELWEKNVLGGRP
ncbi:MAG: AAA family ATPase [Leptospirales bacterium]